MAGQAYTANNGGGKYAEGKSSREIPMMSDLYKANT